MKWSATRIAPYGTKLFAWVEIVDDEGQPIRRTHGSALETDSFIVSGFGMNENEAIAQMSARQPYVMAFAEKEMAQ